MAGGLNTYGYAYQNPVNYIDPDGQVAFLAIPLLGGAGGISSGTLGTALLGGGTLAAIFTIPSDSAVDDPNDDVDADEEEFCPPYDDDDDNDSKDCSKASRHQLIQAGILGSEHEFKKDFVIGALSRYDICACSDGSIVLRAAGQCGRSGPTIPTGHSWK